MKFTLNGEPRELDAPAPVTVGRLLLELDLGERRVAVALNDSVVPKSRYDRTAVEDDDRVEVIEAVGGGG